MKRKRQLTKGKDITIGVTMGAQRMNCKFTKLRFLKVLKFLKIFSGYAQLQGWFNITADFVRNKLIRKQKVLW